MVGILLADGFEEAEAIVPCDILRRGGVDVRLVGLDGLSVTGSHGIRVAADLTMEELDPDQLEMLILPGGMEGVENIRMNLFALGLIQRCRDRGGYIAAICAAPTILGFMGLLERRQAVCYPGLEAELGSALVHKGRQVVVSGHIITGEGPGSAYEFGYQLLETLKGNAAMEEVKHGMHFHH